MGTGSRERRYPTKADRRLHGIAPPSNGNQAHPTDIRASRPRDGRLMDALNDRFGKKSLVLASEGFRDKSLAPQGRYADPAIHDAIGRVADIRSVVRASATYPILDVR